MGLAPIGQQEEAGAAGVGGASLAYSAPIIRRLCRCRPRGDYQSFLGRTIVLLD